MNLVYSDADLDFESDAVLIGRYSEAVQHAAYRALDEEAILVAVHRIRHSI